MDGTKKEIQEIMNSITSLENSINELKVLVIGLNVAMMKANSNGFQRDDGVQNSRILPLPKKSSPQQGRDLALRVESGSVDFMKKIVLKLN